MKLQSIYTPRGYNNSYTSLLATLYNINNLLKRDGIMAPSDSSFLNTKKLYDLIGRPLDKIPTIHIGGTNGKVCIRALISSKADFVQKMIKVSCIFQGSTSFKIAESLRRSGLRTGLFVSPHLASFRERMQVNAELIPESAFQAHLPKVLNLCVDSNIPATFFELTFILACIHYEELSCDAVVLEVRSYII